MKFVLSSKNDNRLVAYLGAAFLSLLLILLTLPFWLQQLWRGQIYPRTLVAGYNLGGMTIPEAEKTIAAAQSDIINQGIEFSLKTTKIAVFPLATSPSDPDLTYEIFDIKVSETVEQAWLSGRPASLISRWLSAYRALLKKTYLTSVYTVNEASLTEILSQNFSNLETPVRNAGFNFNRGELGVVTEKPGELINYNLAIQALRHNLGQLSNQPIVLKPQQVEPEVTYKAVASLISDAQKIISRAPFLLTANSQPDLPISWQANLTASTVASWLVPEKTNGQLNLTFGEGLNSFLQALEPELNQAPRDAKFELVNGRIVQFQASAPGLAIDLPASRQLITKQLLTKQQATTTFVLTKTLPKVSTAEINSLGIQELIGIGKSNFSGSPFNRRKNIQVASEKLNGLLIPPGEEFSLVESLKPFTAEAGYVPELVIKGSRLIPELGGGACQIGTTTFRAALNAGLEITQRRNHSFAVSYYNDENGLPGTDATIYDPAPDFRFVNNTPEHILIQTHVGDDDILTYEFWGTSDGRQASSSKPIILARSPAPATKYIETEDLEPGVTECSGTNVPGYTTTFTYSVLTPEGEYHEENFDSKYRPWQRVCLIGTQPLSNVEVTKDTSTN